MDARDLALEHAKRTNTFRRDLVALLLFVKAREADSAADEQAVVNLFWETWRPRLDSGNVGQLEDNPPQLDQDIEDALLEELARLERERRIRSKPDADFLEEHLEAAVQYVHLGAASALRRRKRDGFTDDVVVTLWEVTRILHLLEIEYDQKSLFVSDLADAHSVIVSQFGVRSLVMGELAYSMSIDGKHQEAFEMAFHSFVCAEAVWDAVNVDREFLLEMVGENRLAAQEEMRTTIGRCLPLQEAQQLVDCFEGLKAQDKSDSWRLVARQCARLAQTLDDDLRESIVLDGNHEATDWYGYWNRARGWAEEHLGPHEFRELRRADEEEASERRLKAYFFGASWEKIPERARGRLVNVDEAWLSRSRGRDYGAVLNDLRVAAEAMCDKFLWKPLEKSPWDQTLQRIVDRDSALRDRGHTPSLPHYASLCEEQGFRQFVQEQGASDFEQQFLHQDLPNALHLLRKLRRDAEHGPEKSFARSEVEWSVRLFLGVGGFGILRRLAEVGPKLSSKP